MSDNNHDHAPAAPEDRPAAGNEPPLTDHAYDGIQEFDNPMPGWWKWSFIVTILFSTVYYAISLTVEGSLGPRYSYEQARIEEQKRQNAVGLTDTGPALLSYIRDDKVRNAGAAIFASNCALCHKPDGGGQVGPNMTDDSYLNIRAIEDIPKFVRSGAKNGAMPSFARMAPNDIIRVSAYVASLRGKNVPGGKPPEGIVIPPWGSAASATKPSTQPATNPATGPTTRPHG
jgi:cytochrome c oxidase cbb3-type subunit 3